MSRINDRDYIYLIWKNYKTGQRYAVGELWRNGKYEFRYSVIDLYKAILTGSLAGHNAVRATLGTPLLILPKALAVGDIIASANEMVKTKKVEKIDIHLQVRAISSVCKSLNYTQ